MECVDWSQVGSSKSCDPYFAPGSPLTARIHERNATDFPRRLFVLAVMPSQIYTGLYWSSFIVSTDAGLPRHWLRDRVRRDTQSQTEGLTWQTGLWWIRVLIGDVSLETHSCPFPSGLTLLKTLIYRAPALILPQMRKANSHLPFFLPSSFFPLSKKSAALKELWEGLVGREESSVPKPSELPT